MVKNCVVSELLNNNEVSANLVGNPPIPHFAKQFTTGAIYKVLNSTKLYVPVVTLSMNDNIKFLENIKQGFRKHKARI